MGKNDKKNDKKNDNIFKNNNKNKNKNKKEESDVEYNNGIYAEINKNREYVTNEQNNIRNDTSDIERLNIEIAELYKRLRPISNFAPSALAIKAPTISPRELQDVILQLKYYKEQLNLVQKDLKLSQEQIQQLFNEAQTLRDTVTANTAQIASLQKDLDTKTRLYEDALLQLIESNNIIKLLEFNQSVSDTRYLITDLNQPYVKHGDDLVAMLSKYIPISNADATYQKLEYRDAEFSNLKNINNIINIVYYAGVIFLFVLLFTSNNVFLSDRYLLYIFLILLPILYPWIYMYTIKIWNYFFPVQQYSGPVNAFVDQTNQPSVYYN
jgi:hypothetical protein